MSKGCLPGAQHCSKCLTWQSHTAAQNSKDVSVQSWHYSLWRTLALYLLGKEEKFVLHQRAFKILVKAHQSPAGLMPCLLKTLSSEDLHYSNLIFPTLALCVQPDFLSLTCSLEPFSLDLLFRQSWMKAASHVSLLSTWNAASLNWDVL